ncbi:DUF4198 domain-containing protein [Luteolibacter pohnpeiensis]|uniref:DUF4198 domain-containing protein n=1 Tax=Luteolibacter pohnpeiensis TaxID=454153 RepID=A0A934SD82_9BACT|nr:DUF4198 domain-containing protein [Luteolibacter pohnpeiensis]MBK1883734.1 DUF4198 domain-containing protein [Luteolibacter pohnpeiensis]
MKRNTLLTTVALLAFAVQPLSAHRFWIIPSSSVLSGEHPWVTVDAAISNSLFFPDHASPGLDSLSVLGPDGKSVALQNGMKGQYRTTFDVELSQPGTYKIFSVRDGLFASYTENGETKRWRGDTQSFAEAGLKDKADLKLTRNNSRVETFVTAGEPTNTVLKPSGEGLELVLDGTHPNDLFNGEPVSFVLQFNGKPAADTEITVVKGDDRYRNEVGEMKLKTDSTGKLTITFPEAGRYWLNASAEGEGGEFEGIPTSSRSSYTATFEVLPQ